MQAIGSGDMSTHNIAWKSALYRGIWATCKSTVGMWYDNECVEFWSIINLLFSGSATNGALSILVMLSLKSPTKFRTNLRIVNAILHYHLTIH